jgi:hypothetical protein
MENDVFRKAREPALSGAYDHAAAVRRLQALEIGIVTLPNGQTRLIIRETAPLLGGGIAELDREAVASRRRRHSRSARKYYQTAARSFASSPHPLSSSGRIAPSGTPNAPINAWLMR